MDISYLLFLQQFRIGINDALTPFLENLSLFAVTILAFFPVFIYWCQSKKSGLRILGALSISRALTAVIKLTVCAYRPWVRDARIIPAGDAIATATGYSFPSGHTTTATSIYGSAAVEYYKCRYGKIAASILVLLVLLTAFSRNYLGVHTPQDVIVGLIVGTISIWASIRFFSYAENKPEKENMILAAMIVLCVLALIYITCKSYPMDYVEGKLLTDPQKMMNDGYKDIGSLFGFCIGRLIEKTWVRFKETGLNAKGIIIGIIGLVILFLIMKFLKNPCTAVFGAHWGGFALHSLIMIYVIAIYPLVIKSTIRPNAE